MKSQLILGFVVLLQLATFGSTLPRPTVQDNEVIGVVGESDNESFHTNYNENVPYIGAEPPRVPEVGQTEIEVAQPELEVIQSEPEVTQSEPEIDQSEPEVAQSVPEVVEKEPEAVEDVPEVDQEPEEDNEDDDIQAIADFLEAFLGELIDDEEFFTWFNSYKTNLQPELERLQYVKERVLSHVKRQADEDTENEDGDNDHEDGDNDHEDGDNDHEDEDEDNDHEDGDNDEEDSWNEMEDEEHSEEKKKKETEILVNVEGRNIYGNAVGNDKVTNFYIFNQYKESEEHSEYPEEEEEEEPETEYIKQ